MAAGFQPLAVLVLAAGKGTRMKSTLPKVLHPLAGRPMLHFAVASAEALEPERLVAVVAPDAGPVEELLGDRVRFAVQEEPRGTGHAVLQAEAALEGFRGDILVLYGDTPLLRSETLRRMQRLKAETGAELVLLSASVPVWSCR